MLVQAALGVLFSPTFCSTSGFCVCEGSIPEQSSSIYFLSFHTGLGFVFGYFVFDLFEFLDDYVDTMALAVAALPALAITGKDAMEPRLLSLA